jgi:hypothetical protein
MLFQFAAISQRLMSPLSAIFSPSPDLYSAAAFDTPFFILRQLALPAADAPLPPFSMPRYR